MNGSGRSMRARTLHSSAAASCRLCPVKPRCRIRRCGKSLPLTWTINHGQPVTRLDTRVDSSKVVPGFDSLAWSSGFIEGKADRQAGKTSQQGDQT